MRMMGKAFRAPKQNNIQQWQKAQLLVEAGFLFHPDGGVRPRTLKDAAEFIEAHRIAPNSQSIRGSTFARTISASRYAIITVNSSQGSGTR